MISAALEAPAETWGLHVKRYEITEIKPDRHISEAMDKQAAAERSKREQVTREHQEHIRNTPVKRTSRAVISVIMHWLSSVNSSSQYRHHPLAAVCQLVTKYYRHRVPAVTRTIGCIR